MDNHKQLLDEAMQIHQQGHLVEARLRYEAILNDEPTHFTALHMTGVIACQQQQYEAGIEIIKRALAINSHSATAHINLANAYEQIGQYKLAIICLARLLVFEPSHREALLKIAQLLQKLYLGSEALVYLDKALELKLNADAMFMKGSFFLKQKEASKALESFNEAIALNANDADAYANAGTALIMLEKYDDAMNYYNKALEVDPTNNAIKANKELLLHLKKGSVMDTAVAFDEPVLSIQQLLDQSEVLMAIGRIDAAIEHIKNALSKNALSKELHNRQGLVFLSIKKYQEALNSFNHSLTIDAHYTDAMINISIVMMRLYQFQNAIEMCEKILLIDSQHVLALNNIGASLFELNQLDEALVRFNRVIELMPEAEFAQLSASFCYLAAGHYQKGWPLYERRWQQDYMRQTRFYIPKPMWSGNESLEGKTIFLYGEQGFGDSLQFSRYISLVAQQNTTILLGVNESIQPLFKRSFPFVELTDKSRRLPDLDYYCPLGSLPLAFNTTLDTIPAKIPYLIPDNQLVKKWEKKLPTGKPRIGIAWRGNPDNLGEGKRSIPLSLLTVLLDIEATFVSLKIDTNEHEKHILESHHVVCADNDIHHFDDTAAIIENLDLIISTDTSIAHLAGALGKPVWIMLAFSADWRWLTKRLDSPWYPSARLFRQPTMADWYSVIQDVNNNLHTWMKQFPQVNT